MNVEKVAKLLHKNKHYIYLGLQQQQLPFGSAVQKPNGKWSYDIVDCKVYEYLGMKVGETNE